MTVCGSYLVNSFIPACGISNNIIVPVLHIARFR